MPGKLGLVEIIEAEAEPAGHFSLYHEEKGSINETFRTAQYAGAPPEKLIRFLYTDEEINEKINQGFYGHTSIGTLIVNDIIKHERYNASWQTFLAQIEPNDFVMVVGSIFGGTGASSIPVVLKELAAKKEELATNQESSFRLATLVLAPYFKAKSLERAEKTNYLLPDSSKFHTKARAMLHYYHEQRQYEMVDEMYVIGEPDANSSYEVYYRGAAKQCNKAHPLELFAASAVLDFIKRENVADGEGIIRAARRQKDKKENMYCYTWEMIRNVSRDLPDYMQRFMKMAVFYNKVIYGSLRSESDPGFWRNHYEKLKSGLDDDRKPIYENIHAYCKRFVNWIYDLHKKNREDIDQASRAKKWDPDLRVRLFNLFNEQSEILFDDQPIEDGHIQIDNFDELVYGQGAGIRAEEIYVAMCSKSPKNGLGKGFVALFSTLYEVISKGHGKKLPQVIPDYENTAFFSMEGGVDQEHNLNFDAEELWTPNESDLLLYIANGLPRAGGNFKGNDISIPSPWSIFIMNELTLTNPSFYDVNAEAYNQWCAMIALLALRKHNRYDTQGLILESAMEDDENNRFFNAVRDNLVPKKKIFTGGDWVQNSFVTLNQKTIAFLANNMLVCPAYFFADDTKKKLHKMAPTIVDGAGKFMSPCNFFKDQPETRTELCQFLNKLRAIIIGRNNDGGTYDIIRSLTDDTNENGQIKGLIPRYITALGGQVANPLPRVGVTVNSVYDIFSMMQPPPPPPPVNLPFDLVNTRSISKRAVLIGKNVADISTEANEAADILVFAGTDGYAPIFYNELDSTKITELVEQSEQYGIEFIHTDTLLLDNMVMVNKEGNKNGFEELFNKSSSSLKNFEVIWPINEKLLELYTTEQLNKNLTLKDVSQRSVTVSLSLEIKGLEINGKYKNTHTVSKTYTIIKRETVKDERRENEPLCRIIKKDDLPFLAVWPFVKLIDNQDVSLWKRYNFLCVEHKAHSGMMEIHPFFESEMDVWDSAPQELSSLVGEPRNIYYRRSLNLPVAFKILEKNNLDIQNYCGSVFLKMPEPPFRRGTHEWNIGLDFGTTSTTAFYTITGFSPTPRPLQLLTEYKWPEKLEDKRDPDPVSGFFQPDIDNDIMVLADFGSRRYLERYFIDNCTLRQNGYTTAYEDLDTNRKDDSDTLFKGGRNFWHNYESFKDVNSTLKGNQRNRLRTGIKWDDNIVFAVKYLNQLMTQIVYYAARGGAEKINWFFSYPTAFSPDNKEEFRRRLKLIIETLATETGIRIDDTIVNVGQGGLLPEAYLFTESIAAANYFKRKYEEEGDNSFLCIDIGGGTSDVSIHVNNKFVFQSSIRFASRTMFVAPLKKLLTGEILKLVAKETGDPIGNMIKYEGFENDTEERVKFFIENVLCEFDTEFRLRLGNLTSKYGDAYNRFKYCVFIAYAGLVYYMANIIAELFISNDIDNSITTMVLGLSGKGSRLTEWIANRDSLYAEAEKLIVERAKGHVKPRFKLKPSPVMQATAKTETACGMLCSLDMDKPDDIPPKVFMGSKVTVTKGEDVKTYEKNDFATIHGNSFYVDLKKVSMKIENIDELDAFIQFFEPIANIAKVKPITMGSIDRDDFLSRVNTKLNKMLSSSGRFDPPFIMILDVFLQEKGYFFND